MTKISEEDFEIPEGEEGYNFVREQESTRSRFALIFIWGFLMIIFILILLTTFAGLASDSTKDFLLAVSSPLGFIVGYYFKSTPE